MTEKIDRAKTGPRAAGDGWINERGEVDYDERPRPSCSGSGRMEKRFHLRELSRICRMMDPSS